MRKFKLYHPLVGLALAVAGGLVLAHFVNKLLDDLDLANSLINNSGALAGWGIALGLLGLIVWKRSSILNWIDSHNREVVIGFCSVVLLCFVLIAIAASTREKAATTPVTFTGPAIPIQ